MSNPINLFPLRTAIEEILVSGSGTPPYVIPTGSFSLETYYEGRLNEQLSFDALIKPNLNITFTNVEDAVAWFQPNTQRLWNVELKIDMAYHADSRFLKSKRSYIETDVYNKGILIANALKYPNNLLTTISGSTTGLVSGRFEGGKISSVKNDYENSVALATITFTGKVCLLNG